MLGHASASMTLDTYADLFDADLDDVAGELGRARQDVYVVRENESTAPMQASVQVAVSAAARRVVIVTVGIAPMAAFVSRDAAHAWVEDRFGTDPGTIDAAAVRVWEMTLSEH